MQVLLHTCWAHCAIIPLKSLREAGFQPLGFFYNPNIHPYQEYVRRKETIENYARRAGLKMIYRDEYDLEGFLRSVVYREHERCRHCYHCRLEAAAQMAKTKGFGAFTTTLLYSKYQNHSGYRDKIAIYLHFHVISQTARPSRHFIDKIISCFIRALSR